MKKKITTLMLALLLVFSISMVVSAASPQSGDAAGVLQSETVVPSSNRGESVSADSPAVQGETTNGPEARKEIESVAEEAQLASASHKNNNTPFFIGAGIAVVLFIGVALYCRANGNKTF